MSASENPPAFPHVTQSKRAGSETIYTHVVEGMSLRDWFAGQALAGTAQRFAPDSAAIVAYQIADAMLAERAKS